MRRRMPDYGLVSFNGWVWPIDKEFIACIKELNTPKKISEYMSENFIHKGAYTQSFADPYKTWKTKKGNCTNFSEFGAFVANYHGYKVYQIGIKSKETFMKHLLTVFVEDNGLSFTSNQDYYNNSGDWFNSLNEIVDFDKRANDWRSKEYTIKCYQDRGISGNTNEIMK